MSSLASSPVLPSFFSSLMNVPFLESEPVRLLASSVSGSWHEVSGLGTNCTFSAFSEGVQIPLRKDLHSVSIAFDRSSVVSLPPLYAFGVRLGGADVTLNGTCSWLGHVSMGSTALNISLRTESAGVVTSSLFSDKVVLPSSDFLRGSLDVVSTVRVNTSSDTAGASNLAHACTLNVTSSSHAFETFIAAELGVDAPTLQARRPLDWLDAVPFIPKPPLGIDFGPLQGLWSTVDLLSGEATFPLVSLSGAVPQSVLSVIPRCRWLNDSTIPANEVTGGERHVAIAGASAVWNNAAAAQGGRVLLSTITRPLPAFTPPLEVVVAVHLPPSQGGDILSTGFRHSCTARVLQDQEGTNVTLSTIGNTSITDPSSGIATFDELSVLGGSLSSTLFVQVVCFVGGSQSSASTAVYTHDALPLRPTQLRAQFVNATGLRDSAIMLPSRSTLFIPAFGDTVTVAVGHAPVTTPLAGREFVPGVVAVPGAVSTCELSFLNASGHDMLFLDSGVYGPAPTSIRLSDSWTGLAQFESIGHVSDPGQVLQLSLHCQWLDSNVSLPTQTIAGLQVPTFVSSWEQVPSVNVGKSVQAQVVPFAPPAILSTSLDYAGSPPQQLVDGGAVFVFDALATVLGPAVAATLPSHFTCSLQLLTSGAFSLTGDLLELAIPSSPNVTFSNAGVIDANPGDSIGVSARCSWLGDARLSWDSPPFTQQVQDVFVRWETQPPVFVVPSSESFDPDDPETLYQAMSPAPSVAIIAGSSSGGSNFTVDTSSGGTCTLSTITGSSLRLFGQTQVEIVAGRATFPRVVATASFLGASANVTVICQRTVDVLQILVPAPVFAADLVPSLVGPRASLLLSHGAYHQATFFKSNLPRDVSLDIQLQGRSPAASSALQQALSSASAPLLRERDVSCSASLSSVDGSLGSEDLFLSSDSTSGDTRNIAADSGRSPSETNFPVRFPGSEYSISGNAAVAGTAVSMSLACRLRNRYPLQALNVTLFVQEGGVQALQVPDPQFWPSSSFSETPLTPAIQLVMTDLFGLPVPSYVASGLSCVARAVSRDGSVVAALGGTERFAGQDNGVVEFAQLAVSASFGSMVDLEFQCQRAQGDVLQPITIPVQAQPASHVVLRGPSTFSVVSGQSTRLVVDLAADAEGEQVLDSQGTAKCQVRLTQVRPLRDANGTDAASFATTSLENVNLRGDAAAAQQGQAQIVFDAVVVDGPVGHEYSGRVECFVATTHQVQHSAPFTVTIQDCPPGQQPGSRGIVCEPCGEDLYSLGGWMRCAKCPGVSEGAAKCDNGVLDLAPGFYVAGFTYPPEEDTRFFECLEPSACIIANFNGSQALRCNEAEGYGGVLCGVCADGYASQNDVCVECFDPLLNILVVTLMAVVFIGIVTYLSAFHTFKPAADPQVILRIMLSYLQILATLGRFKAHGSALFREVFSPLETLGGSIFTLPPIACLLQLGFYTRFLLYMLLPPMVAVLAILVNILVIALSAMQDRERRSLRIVWLEIVRFVREAKYTATVAFFFFIAYTTLAWQVIQMFDCTDPIAGVQYLKADLRIECYDAAHLVGMIGAGMAGLFYMIGVPMTFVFMLKRYRHLLYDPQFFSKYGFLFDGLRDSRSWWESLLMLRKLLVLAVSVLITNAQYQVYASITLVVVSLMMQLVYQPYESKTFNKLEVVSLAALYVTQMTSITYLVSTGEESTATDSSFATASVQEIGVTLVLVVTNALVLLAFFALIVRSLWNAYKLEYRTDLALLELLGDEIHVPEQGLRRRHVCCYLFYRSIYDVPPQKRVMQQHNPMASARRKAMLGGIVNLAAILAGKVKHLNGKHISRKSIVARPSIIGSRRKHSAGGAGAPEAMKATPRARRKRMSIVPGMIRAGDDAKAMPGQRSDSNGALEAIANSAAASDGSIARLTRSGRAGRRALRQLALSCRGAAKHVSGQRREELLLIAKAITENKEISSLEQARPALSQGGSAGKLPVSGGSSGALNLQSNPLVVQAVDHSKSSSVLNRSQAAPFRSGAATSMGHRTPSGSRLRPLMEQQDSVPELERPPLDPQGSGRDSLRDPVAVEPDGPALGRSRAPSLSRSQHSVAASSEEAVNPLRAMRRRTSMAITQGSPMAPPGGEPQQAPPASGREAGLLPAFSEDGGGLASSRSGNVQPARRLEKSANSRGKVRRVSLATLGIPECSRGSVLGLSPAARQAGLPLKDGAAQQTGTEQAARQGVALHGLELLSSSDSDEGTASSHLGTPTWPTEQPGTAVVSPLHSKSGGAPRGRQGLLRAGGGSHLALAQWSDSDSQHSTEQLAAERAGGTTLRNPLRSKAAADGPRSVFPSPSRHPGLEAFGDSDSDHSTGHARAAPRFSGASTAPNPLLALRGRGSIQLGDSGESSADDTRGEVTGHVPASEQATPRRHRHPALVLALDDSSDSEHGWADDAPTASKPLNHRPSVHTAPNPLARVFGGAGSVTTEESSGESSDGSTVQTVRSSLTAGSSARRMRIRRASVSNLRSLMSLHAGDPESAAK